MTKKILGTNKLEKELRDSETYWPNTWGELKEYTDKLLKAKHSYGSCVYAVSLASTAMFNFMSHELGITGFQASCADMDILKRTRHMENGFRILNYSNLLYPQYLNSEHFPSWPELIRENKKSLKEQATKLLRKSKGVHPDVKKHWKYLTSL